MRARIAAIVATIVLGLVVCLTAPAYAEKHKAIDPAGDVSLWGANEEAELVPDDTSTDLTKLVVNHSARRVKITIRLEDLQPASAKASFVAVIKTNELTYDLSLFTTKAVGKTFEMQVRRNGRPINCAAMSKTVSVRDDVVIMSVPRRCLRSPRWVAVGVGAFRMIGEAYLVDDALRSSIRKDGDLAFGPRLKRG